MFKMRRALCNGVLIAMLIGVAENAAAALEHECIPFDAFSAVFCSVFWDGDGISGTFESVVARANWRAQRRAKRRAVFFRTTR
ncbi:hypothetical protein QFZ89_008077 [Paraburkholderia youngii]